MKASLRDAFLRVGSSRDAFLRYASLRVAFSSVMPFTVVPFFA